MFYQIFSIATTILLIILIVMQIKVQRKIDKLQARYYKQITERRARQTDLSKLRVALRDKLDATLQENGKHND